MSRRFRFGAPPSSRTAPFLLAPLLLLALATSAAEEEVRIESVEVATGVHMLVGRGGNIGVSSGVDGLILIDDQFAPLSARILAAASELGEGVPRFVLNTHWHGDHTGGNENLGERGAVIVAQDNVRVRMSAPQFNEAFDRQTPASPAGALPVVTFGADVTFHWNGDEIHAFHVPAAHTDGDAVVHFKVANAIHAGDVYFAGRYPFIDLSSGGSLVGMIAAVDRILGLADAQTAIIPGHGALSDREELAAYRGVLEAARARVGAAIDGGASLEAVLAKRPLAEFDEAWGGGFVDPEFFLRTVYASLSGS